MIQEDIYVKFMGTRKHFVDITGFANWYCRSFPELNTWATLPGVTEKTINTLRFCPFCGKSLNVNVPIDDEPVGRYVVYHYGNYYYGEGIPYEWYGVGFDTWDRAYEEYNGLIGAGFSEDNVYIRDTENGCIFENGEWNV